MQHADEAQLSAYLDKQLEYADSQARRELGRHIADCSKCSKLLKELRSIRTEAEELLERTDTVSVAAPSFDAVVQRARAIRTGEIEIDTPEVEVSLPSRPSRSTGVSETESPVLSAPAPLIEEDMVDEDDLVDEDEGVDDIVEEPFDERRDSPTAEEVDSQESSAVDAAPSFESTEHESVTVDPDSEEDEDEEEVQSVETLSSHDSDETTTDLPFLSGTEPRSAERDEAEEATNASGPILAEADGGAGSHHGSSLEPPDLSAFSEELAEVTDAAEEVSPPSPAISFHDRPPIQPGRIEITQDGADSLLDVPDLDIGRADGGLQITRDVTPESMSPPPHMDSGGLEIRHGAGYEEQDAADISEPVESSLAFESFEDQSTEETADEPAAAAPTFDTTPDFDAAPPARRGAGADGQFLDVLGPEFGADAQDEVDSLEVETAFDSATAKSASSRSEPEPPWEEAEVQPSPSWDEPEAKAHRPWDEADLETNVAPPPANKPARPWNEADLETNVAPPPAAPVHSTPAKPVTAHREDMISLRKQRAPGGQSTRSKPSRSLRPLAMAATVVLAASAGLFADRLGIIDVPFVGDAPSPSQEAGRTQTPRTSGSVADGDQARDETSGRNREVAQQRAAPAEPEATDAISAPSSFVLPEAAIQAAEEATQFADALDPSERALRGRVLDDATGQPVAGVRLEVEGFGLSSTTDSTGQYVMANAPPGDVTIRANAAGYESQEKAVTESDRKDAADFRMARPAETLDASVRRDQAQRALGEAGATAQAPASSAAAKREAPSFDEPGWTEISRAEAEKLLGGPLYVMRNRPIELVARGNDGSVMVRQTVGGGDPLELIIRVAAGRQGENELLEGEPLVESGPNGGSRGTIRKGNYIITANAPVPRAELERLLLGLSEAPGSN